MNISVARVDERLIHGQIINEWVNRTACTHLLIVDDSLVADEFMSNIYKALAPLWLDVQIRSTASAARYLLATQSEPGRIMLLARTPLPFEALARHGLAPEEITLADRRYFPNKLAVPQASKHAINYLLSAGVRVVAQNAPDDDPKPVRQYKV
ncbi:PTS sugar transporter subunit IIB [Pseudoflavonifractor sp. CLA-AP-H29]|uniref:PTS sugar transporter subunit IIB n=1 Tax=Pseudoflavonifractor intestinihominis TaxID=3133171 RepID=A0ABV1EAN0_9FIRM